MLTAAVRGRPPAADGSVEVLPQAGLAAAVVAFSAHFYVCADVEAGWVTDALPAGDYSAPHGARFLTALADRLHSGIGALDVVLAREAARDPALPEPEAELPLEEITSREHPRVRRALRYREDVRSGGRLTGPATSWWGEGWPAGGRWPSRLSELRAAAVWDVDSPRPPCLWRHRASRCSPRCLPATRRRCGRSSTRVTARSAPRSC